MKKGALVVKSHRPWQFAIAVIVLSMFLATLTWVLLDRSHWSFIYDSLTDSQDWKHLWEVNQALEAERTELRERVLMLERITSVDKQTAATLQEEIMQLQEKIYTLKEELEFYQGVMDATRGSQGLNVHGIHVEKLAQARSFRLKMILTHVSTGSAPTEGTMKISVEGRANGESRNLDLGTLVAGEELNLSYKFRSFHRFEVRLELPEGFNAERVAIELKPKARNQAMIREVFDWTAPLNQER